MPEGRLADLMDRLLSGVLDGDTKAWRIVMRLCPELTEDEAKALVGNVVTGTLGFSPAEAAAGSLTAGIALGRALERGELENATREAAQCQQQQP